MGPQRQFGYVIERPPFYHPPRSRPVTFKDPISTTRAGVNVSKLIYDENNLSSLSQDRVLDQNYQSAMSDTLFRQQQQYVNQSNNSDVYNSLPRPYQRNEQRSDHYYINYYQQKASSLYGRGGNYGNQHQQQQVSTMPKILVNDRSTSPYPTSTVHKSMLNSCRSPVSYSSDSYGGNIGHEKKLNGNHAINYSRLVSPTIVRSTPLSSQIARQTGSYEESSNSHQVEASNYQQVAQASPVENPIEFIARPYTQQPLKSPGSGSSRSEEAREFLQRTLPSSPSSISSTVAVTRSGASGSKSVGTPLQAPRLKMADQTVARLNSNLVIPDTKNDEYMWNKQLEQVSIAHQTYRTLPIVQPKPKAHHDLPSGNYMRLNQDPSWDLTRSKSSSQASRDHGRRIELAIKNNEATSSYIRERQAVADTRSSISVYDSGVPVFNYHEYIESTRKAR